MAGLQFQCRHHFTLVGCCGTLLFLAFVAQSCATLSQVNSRGAITPNLQKTSPKQSIIVVQRGEASWYGPGLQGKKTASGDSFDQTKLIAAHKTFPLGSKAKATNLKNGNSVEVEIKDRGPFVEGRIIDLSKAAAEKLGIVNAGTAPVQVELLSGSAPSDEPGRASNN
jgi:rare lipoprotein A (peptidoglycan hydrolase)